MLKVRDKKLTVAVLGGGAGGITAARMLADTGKFAPHIFEAQPRLGGKAQTIEHESTISELGTCYLTRSHRYMSEQMRRYGIDVVKMGAQRFDGRHFLDYVKAGKGAPFLIQVAVYLRLRRKLLAKLEREPGNVDALAEASLPVADWLVKHKLPKMERFMFRALTVMGYGRVQDTCVLHAVRWVDADLLLSGALGQVFMPKDGWQKCWEVVSQDLNVSLASPVTQVDRGDDRVTVHAGDKVQVFDYCVNSLPMDVFNRVCQPTAEEKRIEDNVSWLRYDTVLVGCRDWFSGHTTEAYSAASGETSLEGKLLAARFDGLGEHAEHLYTVGQYPGSGTPAELNEGLLNALEGEGAVDPRVIFRQQWQYFPHFGPSAIEGGILSDLRAAQGQARTYHTGATFSHEAVSSICQHNKTLVSSLLQTTANG